MPAPKEPDGRSAIQYDSIGWARGVVGKAMKVATQMGISPERMRFAFIEAAAALDIVLGPIEHDQRERFLSDCAEHWDQAAVEEHGHGTT